MKLPTGRTRLELRPSGVLPLRPAPGARRSLAKTNEGRVMLGRPAGSALKEKLPVNEGPAHGHPALLRDCADNG